MPTGTRTPTTAVRGAKAAGLPGGLTRRPSRRRTTFEDWQFWWYYNRAAFLHARKQLAGEASRSAPTDRFLGRRAPRREARAAARAFVDDRLIPLLVRQLEDAYPFVRAHATIALGRAGATSGRRATVAQSLLWKLADKNPQVREAAVIGLGLLGARAATRPLVEILYARPEGKKLLGGFDPPAGLRGLAALALGMIGEVQGHLVRDVLFHFSTCPKCATRNLAVSAVLGLGFLNGGPRYIEPVREHLMKIAAQASRDAWVRAHAVVALGRSLAANGRPAGDETLRALTHLLRHDRSAHVRRGAALALGVLIRDPAACPDAVRTLQQLTLRSGAPAGNFAALALGRIGGARAHRTLTDALLRRRHQRRAYAALGLGILCRQVLEDPDADEPARAARERALRDLERTFAKEKEPTTRSALAIALGIAPDRRMGHRMLEALKKSPSATFKGYCAVALGMIGHAGSAGELRALVKSAGGLVDEAATGLALLGHAPVARPVVDALRSARTLEAVRSLTAALGFAGDHATAVALTGRARDPGEKALVRGCACAALGRLGDLRPLGPDARLTIGSNYLATCRSWAAFLNQVY